jgi:hypothetical protein
VLDSFVIQFLFYIAGGQTSADIPASLPGQAKEVAPLRSAPADFPMLPTIPNGMRLKA